MLKNAMSRQHPRWLCPTLNTLVINNFANVYGKNEWDFYFRNPERTGAELRLFYSIESQSHAPSGSPHGT